MDEAPGPNWPSAVVALGFLAFVASVFLTVYHRDGLDGAIKVWGVIGTVIGVLIGAIPSYFFHQAARSAQKNSNALLRVVGGDEEALRKARTFGFKD